MSFEKVLPSQVPPEKKPSKEPSKIPAKEVEVAGIKFSVQKESEKIMPSLPHREGLTGPTQRWVKQRVAEAAQQKPPGKLDSDFLCSKETVQSYEPFIDVEMRRIFEGGGIGFDSREYSAGFLAGEHREHEEQIQQVAVQMRKLALAIAETKGYSTAEEKDKTNILIASYKQCTGLIDEYDRKLNEKPWTERTLGQKQMTSFPLRCAVLMASGQDGAPLDSWMVFTKAGKPVAGRDMWSFVENWKNWVPEAQGAIAKFAETSIVHAAALASSQVRKGKPSRVAFLKGGFGAGKTSFARGKFTENAQGILAPDKAKNIVRRAMPSATHDQAHIQGSQTAFAIFHGLVAKLQGTVVYDSAMTYASDVTSELAKAKAAGKKPVIYDIARTDTARILSVLSRGFGEDPRINPERILKTAVDDKMERAKCMEAIQSDPTRGDKAPVYHFFCSDSQGTNSQEVMTLRAGQPPQFSQSLTEAEINSRLASEGLYSRVESEGNISIQSTSKREDIEASLRQECNLPVNQILQTLSPAIIEELTKVFEKREFRLLKSNIRTPEELYEALDPSIQNILPKKSLIDGFAKIPQSNKSAFFDSIAGKDRISYLDLPLYAALNIHSQLQKNPW